MEDKHLKINAINFAEELPAFRIGDRVIVRDRSKDFIMQSRIEDWEAIEHPSPEQVVTAFSDVVLECCLRGTMISRNDVSIRVENLRDSTGEPSDPDTRWIPMEDIIAVLGERQ